MVSTTLSTTTRQVDITCTAGVTLLRSNSELLLGSLQSSPFSFACKTTPITQEESAKGDDNMFEIFMVWFTLKVIICVCIIVAIAAINYTHTKAKECDSTKRTRQARNHH